MYPDTVAENQATYEEPSSSAPCSAGSQAAAATRRHRRHWFPLGAGKTHRALRNSSEVDELGSPAWSEP